MSNEEAINSPAIRARLEAATKVAPAPWHHDTIKSDGSYGSGEDTSEGFSAYQVLAYVDGKWRSVVDTLNSDLTVVHEDHDEDGKSAWDETGRHTLAFIANAPTDIAYLLDALKTAEQERDQHAAQVGVLLAALKKYQWTHRSGLATCPCCGKAPSSGHWEMCEIKKLLATLPATASALIAEREAMKKVYGEK